MLPKYDRWFKVNPLSPNYGRVHGFVVTYSISVMKGKSTVSIVGCISLRESTWLSHIKPHILVCSV